MIQQEKPEEEKIQESESLDFSKPDYIFSPPGNHIYRQQGVYLVCKSCDIQHAVYVGIERIMIGVDKQGKPILKKRKDIGM